LSVCELTGLSSRRQKTIEINRSRARRRSRLGTRACRGGMVLERICPQRPRAGLWAVLCENKRFHSCSRWMTNRGRNGVGTHTYRRRCKAQSWRWTSRQKRQTELPRLGKPRMKLNVHASHTSEKDKSKKAKSEKKSLALPLS
jgi:hypothetical protein